MCVCKMCIRDRLQGGEIVAHTPWNANIGGMESDPPSIQEIEEAISALRNNKAPGTDSVSYTHLDVYKRQDLMEALTGPCMFGNLKRLRKEIIGRKKTRQFYSFAVHKDLRYSYYKQYHLTARTPYVHCTHDNKV